MSEHTTAASELASQYAAQVTGDLDRNVKEQDRVTAEITALQDQLAVLQQDHSVLVNMQKALSATPAQSASGTVPAPRTKANPDRAGKGTRVKKSTAAAPAPAPANSRSKAKKPTAGTTSAKDTASKTPTPTLVELVRGHLAEQGEPRSAAEIATALGEAHPDRSFKTTVVRNTLENLVAKGHAQRSKQGSSVFYTAPDAAGQAPQAPAEEAAPAQSE